MELRITASVRCRKKEYKIKNQITKIRKNLFNSNNLFSFKILNEKLQIYLIGSECDLATTSSTTSYATIVTNVSHPVSKLGLEANMTSGFQFYAGFLMLFIPLSDCFFQDLHLVLFSPVKIIFVLNYCTTHKLYFN